MTNQSIVSKVCCLSALLSACALQAATVDVLIQNFAFNPSSVTINVGDTVTWRQIDTTQHTSTSDSGIWNSGVLNQGQSFSHTFNTAGTFGYFCQPHPFMTGTITVQGTAANPPTVSIASPVNNAT